MVAEISRALTDESLRTSLHSAISHFAPSNGKESKGKVFKVAVICTKTDVSILWTLGHNITDNKKDIDVRATERELGSESDFPVSRMKGLDSAIKKASSRAHKQELEKM